MSVETETAIYLLRVEGVQQERTLLLDRRDPFDETYEIMAEHPADALDKLLHEIEWGILDSYSGFTITVLPSEGDDDA